MKLLRLHIQGFKSFKDKTTIHFDQGITGIVGPNGCGKSNIVDALFWVMGEQSAKHLRGKKMSDLIFSGSTKYAPGSWAEVTLVLENDTGKHIHINNQVTKPNEIALTRKLYRNGETEYRINGHPARLKDIQEVFMDTGAGAKSYSIIAQGEINRLVQAKPEERRVMIEEVAGITKFKLRKRESLKKIEHTENNLGRLSDLQNEIYKNLKVLERQAEKAEKARNLKKKIKRHELIVESHKEHDFLKEYHEGKGLITTKSEALEKDTLEKEAIELALEDERLKKAELMDRVDHSQAEFNELSKELAASEERLNSLKRSATEKEKYIEEKKKENEEILEDLESRKNRFEELTQQLTDLKESNAKDADFSTLEEKVELLKEELGDNQNQLSDVEAELTELRAKFAELDQEEFKNNSKLEEYASTLQDINSEIESLEKHSSNFSEELTEQREKVKTLEVQKEELEGQVDSLKQSSVELEKEYDEVDKKVRELTKEVIQLESKRQSLIEINNQDDITEGANQFVEYADAAYSVLGNLVESEQEYGKAVETLFSNKLQSVISNQSDYSNLASWSNNDKLAWDFLAVEKTSQDFSETAQRLEIRGCAGVKPVLDVVKINNTEYSENLKAFFNGYFVVDSIDVELALKVSSDIDFKGLVARDGSVIIRKENNTFKISYRNPEDAGMGVVQRNNLINELSESLEQKEAILSDFEKRFTELSEEREQVKLSLEAQAAQFTTVNNEYISLKSSLDSKEDSFKTSFSRLEILSNRKNEISSSRLDLLENEESLAKEKELVNESIETKQAIYEELADKTADLKTNYETERESLVELQAQAKSFDSQLVNLESQLSDVENQVERYNTKLENNKVQQETLASEIEEIESTLAEQEKANLDKVQILKDKEEALNLQKDDLTELLSAMQDRENRVKELTQNINKYEKSLVEINMKIEKIIEDEELLVRNVFEKYQIDLRSILAKYLEISMDNLEELKDVDSMYFIETEDGQKRIDAEEYEFDKRFPAQVRESRDKFKQYRKNLNYLGEINWQAIEDYDRQKLRYDFLRAQEQELKKSLEDLQTAIDHIDEKSKARFKEAFEEVNSRFTKVFPIIFGGGSAKLQVTGHLDSIECGIEIIAQPPGKKMQNINLMSGGEKAMTAVSLIFSIFLVKPSPFCLLDEVDAPLDDANVGRFNELLREMSNESQFILITHNKKTMELNDTLYGVTMQEPGISKAVSVQLH